MPRLRPLPHRKIIKILKNNDFKLVRTKKHSVFKRRTEDGVLTTLVPKPHKKDISVFVIKSIIRRTNKSEEEFY